MGLYRRRELTAAARQTLAAIRATLPADSTRVRFDHLFRPRGEWIVDLHDAALAWARSRAPGIGWGTASRSLAAAHWLDTGDSLAEEAVPRALYGLTVLAASDSAAFRAARSDLWRADSVAASAVLLLLAGYAESQNWFVDALRFFLTQPWIPDGARGRSLADYRAGATGAGWAAPTLPRTLPEIQASPFRLSSGRAALRGSARAVPASGQGRQPGCEELARASRPGEPAARSEMAARRETPVSSCFRSARKPFA